MTNVLGKSKRRLPQNYSLYVQLRIGFLEADRQRSLSAHRGSELLNTKKCHVMMQGRQLTELRDGKNCAMCSESEIRKGLT